MGLLGAGERPQFEALTGGVSSDIWRVELGDKTVCVKRALPKLKVAADWHAPIERNALEVAWFEVARGITPAAVPEILAHDPAAGCFVMAYLDPEEHTLWKDRLRDGEALPEVAASVATTLGRIHAGTAGDTAVAATFKTDETFHAIRLEPYLEATARVHTDLAEVLTGLVSKTSSTRLALVHGDVSPKNIMIGPQGPVFLDAECAWYGDPAFDIAFCLNHFLLKCLWTPQATEGFLTCFDEFSARYLGQVSWEPPAVLETRAAQLLPGLFLARVDGKSPVEYVTRESEKDLVRKVARRLLTNPVNRLAAINDAWRKALDR